MWHSMLLEQRVNKACRSGCEDGREGQGPLRMGVCRVSHLAPLRFDRDRLGLADVRLDG